MNKYCSGVCVTAIMHVLSEELLILKAGVDLGFLEEGVRAWVQFGWRKKNFDEG